MKSLSFYVISLLVVVGAVHGALQLPWRAMDDAVLNPDAYEYFDAARRLYAWPPLPHPTRLFGWPLLTGWITRYSEAFWTYYAVCYGLNVVLLVGTGVLLWRIGPVLAPGANRWTRLPAWLFAFNVGSIVLASQPLTETFYTFLLVAAAGAWAVARARGNDRWLLMAWGAFCISAVVRPTAALWLLPLGGALGWHFTQKNTRWRSGWLGLLLPVLLTVGLQSAAMRAVYGTWRLTHIGPWTYYFYTDAYARAWSADDRSTEPGAAWLAETARRRAALGLAGPQHAALGRVTDWPALERHFAAAAWQSWREQSWAVATTLGRNLASNSVGGSMQAELVYRSADASFARIAGNVVFWLSRVQNALYSLAAALLLLALIVRKRRRFAGPTAIGDVFVVFCAFVVAASAISFAQGDRFHVVVAPLIALSALNWRHYGV